MKHKAYFKVELELLSPLSIGASNSEDTDSDIFLNSKNQPMIPGTSIAGVFRSLEKDEEKIQKYFGEVTINKDVNDQQPLISKEGELKFYDAQLSNTGHETIAARDCVALNENKTAIQGAKFDFQVVETGAVFIGFIETITADSCAYVKNMLKAQIHLGAKTTRGYGRVKVRYKVKEFDISDPKVLEEWLDFDMFEDAYADTWQYGLCEQEEGGTKIVLSLEQKGGLSIRRYLTEPSRNKDDQQPDYGPLTLKDHTPVIPGTSWAGMFRQHVSKLLESNDAEEIKRAFGFVDEKKKESQKSNIQFSESKLSEYQTKVLTRNALDRFTNGTKDGALYTEMTVYGGKTSLEILLNKNAVPQKVICAICATIVDLNEGYAAVGGLTAVGRGLFSVTEISVNQTSLSFNQDQMNNYLELKEAIGNA